MDFKQEAERILESTKEKNEVDVNLLKEAQELSQSSSNTPKGYIPIELSTKGKFSLPPVINIRNFDTSEVIELSSQVEENRLATLIKIFNNAVYEDIDMSQATEQELTEIALNIYANWYGVVISNFSFPLLEKDIEWLDTNEPKTLEKIQNREYYPSVDILISDIEIKDIDEKFKEPITITNSKTQEVFQFKLPRVGDGILTQEYVRKKYADEDNIFYRIQNKLQEEKQLKTNKSSITMEERRRFEDYQQRRTIEHIRVIQKLCLLSYNGEVLNNIEDKMKISIPQNIWDAYKKIVEKYSFGVQNEVKVKSPLNGKEEIRRFQFRPQDFIFSMEYKEDSELDISFG